MKFMHKYVRKLINRSGKSICDICYNKHILVTHHINGRDIPNCDHPSNLADICPNCHESVHRGIIVIEKWVNSTNGLELLWHYDYDKSFTGDDAKPYLR